jgi:hypothetical protein
MFPWSWRSAVVATASLCLLVTTVVAGLHGQTPAGQVGANPSVRAQQVRTGPEPARKPDTTRSDPAQASSTADAGVTRTAPRPPQVLPDQMHGRAAVRALGSRLSAVAAQNSVSASRLTQLLTEDHTAWLSAEGRLFYQEDAPVEEASASPSTAAATVAPAYPTNQTFALHSRPGATRKVFLDFNGGTVENTGWNGAGDPQITPGPQIGQHLRAGIHPGGLAGGL